MFSRFSSKSKLAYAANASLVRTMVTTGSSSLRLRMFPPVRVAITGARGSVGTNLAFRVALGDMFGPNQPVILQLYSREKDQLLGLRLELEDTCSPLLAGIIASDNYEEVFGDADYTCMVGSPPRTEGMERGDLLKISGSLFKHEGQILGEVAKSTCKVIVVGNPANTNAMIAAANSKNVPPENFTAMTRLDHNRALFQLGKALTVKNSNPNRPHGIHATQIDGLTIWGNHSHMMYPDVSHATVQGERVTDMLGGNQWIRENFIPRVQQRGKEIITARGSSSAPSAAQSCVDQIKDWVLGTDGKWTSMAVMSGNSDFGVDAYGIESGLFFSYPVVCSGGTWRIVSGLTMDEFGYQMLQRNVQELKAERDSVKDLL